MQLKSTQEGIGSLTLPEAALVTMGNAGPVKRFSTTYRTPEISFDQTVLARLVANQFLYGSAITLYIQEHEVFESAENEFFFITFRNLVARHDAGSIDDTPFLVFEPHEANLFECFFALALYYLWDVVAFTEDGTVLVSCSHDEAFRIQTDDAELYESILATLAPLEYKVLYTN